MSRSVGVLTLIVFLSSALFAGKASPDAEKFWSLEKAYWKFVPSR